MQCSAKKFSPTCDAKESKEAAAKPSKSTAAKTKAKSSVPGKPKAAPKPKAKAKDDPKPKAASKAKDKTVKKQNTENEKSKKKNGVTPYGEAKKAFVEKSLFSNLDMYMIYMYDMLCFTALSWYKTERTWCQELIANVWRSGLLFLDVSPFLFWETCSKASLPRIKQQHPDTFTKSQVEHLWKQSEERKAVLSNLTPAEIKRRRYDWVVWFSVFVW